LEVAGDRGELAAFDEARLPAAALALAGDFAQKGGLADPADPVDEHHRSGRVVDEQAAEVGEFRLATDESLLVASRKALGKGGWQGWTPDSRRLYLPGMTADAVAYYAAMRKFLDQGGS